MLVENYLYEAYKGFLDDSSQGMERSLEIQVDVLRKWGERHGATISDPGRMECTVVKVLEYEGKPMECPIERVLWPLQQANKELLPEVDRAIVEAFKNLKKAGWVRPSVVAYGGYFEHIHSKAFDEKWKSNPSGLRGVHLVNLRLESTARLAARYEFGEKFGPRYLYDKNWELVGCQYDNTFWRTEMVRRGLLPRPKHGGQ